MSVYTLRQSEALFDFLFAASAALQALSYALACLVLVNFFPSWLLQLAASLGREHRFGKPIFSVLE